MVMVSSSSSSPIAATAISASPSTRSDLSNKTPAAVASPAPCSMTAHWSFVDEFGLTPRVGSVLDACWTRVGRVLDDVWNNREG